MNWKYAAVACVAAVLPIASAIADTRDAADRQKPEDKEQCVLKEGDVDSNPNGFAVTYKVCNDGSTFRVKGFEGQTWQEPLGTSRAAIPGAITDTGHAVNEVGKAAGHAGNEVAKVLKKIF